jgi:hypothetical protein
VVVGLAIWREFMERGGDLLSQATERGVLVLT